MIKGYLLETIKKKKKKKYSKTKIKLLQISCKKFFQLKKKDNSNNWETKQILKFFLLKVKIMALKAQEF